VKYVTPKKGVLDVNCRSSNNWSILHFTPKDIDILAAYDSINKSIYFVPSSKINHSLFKLRIDEPRNNQKAKIHFAEDFLSI